MNKPVVSLKMDQLFTHDSFCEPVALSRRWKLVAGSMVTPIALSGAKGRYFAMTSQLTERDWFFAEKDAHLLPFGMFEQLQYAHFHNELPVFILFPNVVIWDQQQVVGFVSITTKLVQVDGGPGVTVKMNIPPLINPKATPNPTAATTFGKPVAKRFQFSSSSSKGITYETVVYKDKTVSCNCPGWTKRADRTCKHTKNKGVLDYIKSMP